jgi:hypothetical protein
MGQNLRRKVLINVKKTHFKNSRELYSIWILDTRSPYLHFYVASRTRKNICGRTANQHCYRGNFRTSERASLSKTSRTMAEPDWLIHRWQCASVICSIHNRGVLLWWRYGEERNKGRQLQLRFILLLLLLLFLLLYATCFDLRTNAIIRHSYRIKEKLSYNLTEQWFNVIYMIFLWYSTFAWWCLFVLKPKHVALKFHDIT